MGAKIKPMFRQKWNTPTGAAVEGLGCTRVWVRVDGFELSYITIMRTVKHKPPPGTKRSAYPNSLKPHVAQVAL